VDFAFSAEQEMLRAAAREYLTDRVPPERVVTLAETDPAARGAAGGTQIWATLSELGWLDLEDFLDEAVLFEEAGRALLPVPYLATVALTRPALVTEQPATLAWAEDAAPLLTSGGWATAADSAGRLTGVKRLVPDLAVAERVVVVAADGLYAVDVTPQLVTALSTVDRLRPLANLTLDGTPGERVGDLDLLPLMRRRAFAALAGEAGGVAQSALDLATAHAKERQQFGRIIGTYQAVSHQIADIFTALALARSLATWAAWTVSADDEGAELACAAAKSAAGDAAVVACEKAIQVHGGVGFTYEHILHRYYKRAQWISAFEGTGRAQRAELATALLGRQPVAS
jgi:alkylation response protein AidB-like acyl-CoA dehydrogenase